MKTTRRSGLLSHLAGIGYLFLANMVTIVLLALLSSHLTEQSLYQPAFLCKLAINGIGLTQLCYVAVIRRWFNQRGYRQVARGVTGGAEITLFLTIAWFVYIFSGAWI
ncbi:MAG: hypothetical protein AAFR18_21525 [Cyanobacteria bacterium J06627_32]